MFSAATVQAMRALEYCLLASVLTSAPSFAQRSVPVEITYAQHDIAARAVAAQLREAINRSRDVAPPAGGHVGGDRGYELRVTMEPSRPHIRLQLMTAEIEAIASTAVFASLVYDSPHMPLRGAFVSSMVETGPRIDATQCVPSILQRTVAATDWLRDRWPGLWQTL